MYIDLDYAGDKHTQISRSVLIIYMNRSLIVWFLKIQANTKTMVFGTQCLSMKVWNADNERIVLQNNGN